VGIERVNPPSLAAPSGFAHAIVATGGQVVFLAGQTALNAAGEITGDTVVEQFERALTNLLAALAAAGGRPADLTSLTVYAVDLAGYREHGREIGAIW
jgi:enamine deaminase RidA (YjgF/YER057c/UK114 family)